MSSPIDPADLLAAMQWRYATKRFDPARRIPDDVWSALEQTLVLTPSSYGMQPWEFLVVTRQDLKESLVPHSWGQRQVADCSHLLVITCRKTLGESDVDRLMKAIELVQGRSAEQTKGYRDMIVQDLVAGPRSQDVSGWARLQGYIALGNFMSAAALLGIDTCPMEGFLPDAYDEALGLAERGLTTAVLCPAGYRHPEDKYAFLPKVRFPASEVVRHIA
jgi:nitroreductase